MPIQIGSNFKLSFNPKSIDVPGDYLYEFRYYWHNFNDESKGYVTIGTLTFTVVEKVETVYLRLVGNSGAPVFNMCNVFKE